MPALVIGPATATALNLRLRGGSRDLSQDLTAEDAGDAEIFGWNGV